MNTQSNIMTAWKDAVTYREQKFFHKSILQLYQDPNVHVKCFNLHGSIHVFGVPKISRVVHNQEKLLCSWSEFFTFSFWKAAVETF